MDTPLQRRAPLGELLDCAAIAGRFVDPDERPSSRATCG